MTRRFSGGVANVAALILALLVAAAVPAGAQELPAPIARALADSGLPASSVGLWVQRVDEDQPIVAHSPDRAFNPASTIKLSTTFAALAELGQGYQWMTDVRIVGALENGVLDGDLVLQLVGDPGLNTERYHSLIAGIRRAGVREIRGDVILDGSAFSVPVDNPGAFDNQPLRAYNQSANALHVNASAINFFLYPEANGLRIATDPELPGLRIENRVTLGGGSCAAWQRGVSFDVRREGSVTTAVFDGTYPRQCGVYNLYRVAFTPEDYHAEMFRHVWRMHGGSFAGQVVVDSTGRHQAAERIYRHASPGLSETLWTINKWSNNIHARHVALTLGAERFGAPATVDKARRAIAEVLAENGVDVTGLLIDNGSGLSRSTRITPRQMGQLLTAAWRHPTRNELLASMSVAGVDGTFRRRFGSDDEASRIHLKTGRLNGVAALSGFVRTDRQREYAVVVLINHADAHGAGAQRFQDAVLSWALSL